jgi:hypothetical protein
MKFVLCLRPFGDLWARASMVPSMGLQKLGHNEAVLAVWNQVGEDTRNWNDERSMSVASLHKAFERRPFGFR